MIGLKRKFKSDIDEICYIIKELDCEEKLKEDLLFIIHNSKDIEIFKEESEEMTSYPFLVNEYTVTNNGELLFSVSVTLGGEVSLLDLDSGLI